MPATPWKSGQVELQWDFGQVSSHIIPLAIAAIGERLLAAHCFSSTVRDSPVSWASSLVHSDADSAQEDEKRLLKRASGFICGLPRILHDST